MLGKIRVRVSTSFATLGVWPVLEPRDKPQAAFDKIKWRSGGRSIQMRCRFMVLLLLVSHGAAQMTGRERGEHRSRGMPEAPLPTREQIRQAIALSAGYLERACGPDGKFVYEITTPFGEQ